ncbi:PREDICTED: uncharacterized protein LOC109170887 [Ipomoea nil]|uniref:uncharacterized protein LOC109170887 n=1 Tax=Ipomoea nil TaxID=35883 RepID=UPI000900A21F|nr:PREDICTED: uncharacterized protein LOC109170887 [Ipomoea nil]
MYGKVYVRGKFYDFNQELINEYLGSSNEDQGIQLESEQIALEITAGNVVFEKNKIKAASLTSKYAILQKIALVNWMPSLHESKVKRSLAELLYKIGKGIKVNLGTYIHSQITNIAEDSVSKTCLIFPSLIYSLLAKQGLKTHGPKVQINTINTTKKLRKGGHQNDLKPSAPSKNLTDQKILTKYFKKRLEELELSEKQILKRQMKIKEEKAEIIQWIKALETTNEEEEEAREEEQADSTEKEEDNQEKGVETSVSTSS